MKRVFAFCILFLAISYSSFAQNKGKTIPEPKNWADYKPEVMDLIVVKSVQFEKWAENDKSKKIEFTSETYSRLDEIAKFLILNPLVRIEIRSHSETSGEFGKRLTDNQAKVIRDYLVAKNIQSFRLNATGYANTMPSEEWRNDRIEIRILSISED